MHYLILVLLAATHPSRSRGGLLSWPWRLFKSPRPFCFPAVGSVTGARPNNQYEYEAEKGDQEIGGDEGMQKEFY